jgi:hypothetical protein
MTQIIMEWCLVVIVVSVTIGIVFAVGAVIYTVIRDCFKND